MEGQKKHFKGKKRIFTHFEREGGGQLREENSPEKYSDIKHNAKKKTVSILPKQFIFWWNAIRFVYCSCDNARDINLTFFFLKIFFFCCNFHDTNFFSRRIFVTLFIFTIWNQSLCDHAMGEVCKLKHTQKNNKASTRLSIGFCWRRGTGPTTSFFRRVEVGDFVPHQKNFDHVYGGGLKGLKLVCGGKVPHLNFVLNFYLVPALDTRKTTFITHNTVINLINWIYYYKPKLILIFHLTACLQKTSSI